MLHDRLFTRGLLACVLLSVLISPPAFSAQANATKKRMNVLFIVCDDLNNRLGCYGYKDVISPNLDKFAAESVRFDRAYCQFPVCNPSRSSFLTGLRPETTKILNNYLKLRDQNPGIVTLPECFRQQGYWTAGVGKIFHGHKNDEDNCWDERKHFGNARNPVIEEARRKFEAEHGPVKLSKNKKRWKKIGASKELRKLAAGQAPAGYGPTDMTDDEHCDGQNVRQCIDWLANKAYGDKPFFMVCGIQRPHVPFWAPKKYFNLYPLERIDLVNDPASDWDDIPELALWGRYKVFMQVPRCPDDSERRKAQQSYYACITHIDTVVGRLLDTVKKQALWDDTIIIFTSDHGYHLGEHGMWGKVTHFEPCDRIPFMVHVPGLTGPGSVCTRLIEFVDLYPSLVDLCGLKGPHEFEGISFKPLLERPDREWKKAVFTVVQRGPGQSITCKAVRTERWRYSEWDKARDNELYDLKNDPNEWYNLARDAEYAETVKQMRKMLYGGWKEALPAGYK
ncbi:MAG: sulfatase [Planctomycetota bacterium]|jgi:arylsulfatase A-like enzyme